ncbi:Na+/H+ antiporter NhaA [Microbacterium sp. cx-59]|uniref:Na+/H+ antiporter NhaA n=1 Tax=Microbacterium sp. cx-59 TaxID=2891207 RepID=UPI001E3BE805|nr:Na+/H+ antiporter NhaA [Microbacterium sp. cx-59]MCC4906778.1 Na+/H+ antiporter NhaA [Microbacterium sp. cx-59]
MSLLRSERFPAVVLLVSSALGLVLANSPWGPAADAVSSTSLGIPGVFTLSLGHWVQDGLLAVFFFVVAIELREELTSGQLHPPTRALQPAIAAAGGVLVPIAIFAAMTAGSPSSTGWPIPTATDIAFALGVLAVFGRGLPTAVRTFLLALAILDDVVGIVFIAVLFTDDVNLALLAAAAILVGVFGVLSRRAPGWGVGAGMLIAALAAWGLVYLSGVHATIAGVALGLVMASRPAHRVRHALEPWVNGLVLPLFALSAALVVIPAVGFDELQPVFWGVVIALPVGKVVGIAVFGAVAQRILGHPSARLPWGDLFAAGALGGIGFTVSLLLAELAFAGDGLLRDEATLGVLTGSVISLVLAAILVSWRARHYRRVAEEIRI